MQIVDMPAFVADDKVQFRLVQSIDQAGSEDHYRGAVFGGERIRIQFTAGSDKNHWGADPQAAGAVFPQGMDTGKLRWSHLDAGHKVLLAVLADLRGNDQVRGGAYNAHPRD